jgi:hypothetical protein
MNTVNNTIKRYGRLASWCAMLGVSATLVAACGTLRETSAPALPGSESIAVVSVANFTEEKKLEWARSQQIRYVLTGEVEEWRYKVGVDGEPAVGLTFELVDVDTGKTVWSGTGSRTGWSRSGLASVANKLIGDVLAPVHAGS